MPRSIEQVAQLLKQPAHPARQLLTPIPGERSNHGVGSGGLDNRGTKNGESGEHHNRPGAAGERGRKTKWASSLRHIVQHSAEPSRAPV
jgi:hypothetical protein